MAEHLFEGDGDFVDAFDSGDSGALLALKRAQNSVPIADHYAARVLSAADARISKIQLDFKFLFGIAISIAASVGAGRLAWVLVGRLADYIG